MSTYQPRGVDDGRGAGAGGSVAGGDEARGVEAKAAFARLKTLAGSWETRGEGHGHSGKIDYKVTGNGSVVMETFFPGTDHEMISMYHLDTARTPSRAPERSRRSGMRMRGGRRRCRARSRCRSRDLKSGVRSTPSARFANPGIDTTIQLHPIARRASRMTSSWVRPMAAPEVNSASRRADGSMASRSPPAASPSPILCQRASAKPTRSSGGRATPARSVVVASSLWSQGSW